MTNSIVKTLKGSVYYEEKIAPPLGFTLHLSLYDQADPNIEIASQTSSDFRFTLTFDLADIIAGHKYAITAQIKSQGIVHYSIDRPRAVNVLHNQRRPLLIRLQRQYPAENK